LASAKLANQRINLTGASVTPLASVPPAVRPASRDQQAARRPAAFAADAPAGYARRYAAGRLRAMNSRFALVVMLPVMLSCANSAREAAAFTPLTVDQAQPLVGAERLRQVPCPTGLDSTVCSNISKYLHAQLFQGESGKSYLIQDKTLLRTFFVLYSVGFADVDGDGTTEMFALSDPCSGNYCPILEVIPERPIDHPRPEWRSAGCAVTISSSGERISFEAYDGKTTVLDGGVSWDSQHNRYLVAWPECR